MYVLYMPCRFILVSLQEEKDKLKLKFDKYMQYMLENKTINYLIIFFKSMTIPLFMHTKIFSVYVSYVNQAFHQETQCVLFGSINSVDGRGFQTVPLRSRRVYK